ncbi:sensor histidine kinase [Bacillus sp. JJ1609]|uniref:sensor histidine kinase n=1 Tax=Bacillus sp. JJ1609 TaxID=3122977 RepID=UPI00300048BE
MLNSKSIRIAFKMLVVSLILYEILTNSSLSVAMRAIFIAGIVMLQANDFLRIHFRLSERHRALYTVSMVVNISAIAVCMVLLDSAATGLYYIFPIVEMFLSGRSIDKGIMLLHGIVYLAAMYVAKADVQNSLLSYFATLLLIYLFRGISLERGKSQLLHAELAEAHAKLREVTIVKERTRIAQEMHDSLGHSLIALRMHLEFAENMIDTNPKQVREVLAKAHHFSQNSIKELRRAVAVLKDQSVNSQIELKELLNDMIESLQTSGTLKFILNFDREVESGDQDLKNCIYNSVREAVTNGLKHGKAQQFLIDITQNGDQIQVFVEDDGTGCSQIKKSHGLKGIEERIGLLNGKVSFFSEKGRGFKVFAEIPVRYKTNAAKLEVI